MRPELERGAARGLDTRPTKGSAPATGAAPKSDQKPVVKTKLADDDALINSNVEVTFLMKYKEAGKKTVEGLFGCPGKITRVSDATTTIRRKKIGLGWAFIEYTDGSEDWQLLRPAFYKAKRAGGWRLISENDANLDIDYELEDKSDGDSDSDDNESGGGTDESDDESDSD